MDKPAVMTGTLAQMIVEGRNAASGMKNGPSWARFWLA